MSPPPPPNDSSKASLSPPVGKCTPFFQKRLANKQLFIQRVKHYHQWLHTAIPFKPKSGQIPSDSVRVQGSSKRPSSGHLYPVSSVKEHNQKGGKCKISQVLQSPVSSTQASPKVETSHRPNHAQHFSTRRKVQNGNSRVHQDLPDSRGMGIVNRPVGCLPSHPHPSKLKEIPKVLLQVPGVHVHLPPIRTSHVMRGADLHPKDHSIQLFIDASNKGWGAHLDQSFTKGLWSDQEKRLHVNILELKAVSLALRSSRTSVRTKQC